ncbi:unnamed protein product [Brachionus calyciflorus]|uniref:Major facilitator superfamily (MFS) profile domain-containing protein n=1 Tax=Brachionus calyciflorus TaxID=104777 RepID=A0A813PJT7_9BILA|nr:unnamed protein product [Brachionus calyciflorus]
MEQKTDNEILKSILKKPDHHGSVLSLLPQTLSEFNLKIKMKPKREKISRIPANLRKNSHIKQTNLDHVLDQIGSFGFYQKIQFFLVGFLAIVPSMVAFSYVFVSATPKFTCSLVQEIQLISYDETAGKLLNRFIIDQESDDPFEELKSENSEFFIETRRFIRVLDPKIQNITFDNNCKIDSSIFKNKKNLNSTASRPSHGKKMLKSTFKCVEWAYDDSLYGRTTVTDWNLVCLKSHLKALTQNAYILGTGCSVFTGILSDKLGRKTAMILLITLMVLVLNTTQFFMHTKALSINQKFVIFTISRFIQGIAQTMYSISFVLLLEITGPKNRVTAGNILAYSFSIGQLIIAGLAYFFKDYLKVQWALAIYVMPFFMYYWLVPESPRWLLSVNKVRQARTVLEKITRVNNRYENFKQQLLDYLFAKKIQKKTNVDLENQESWVYIFSLLQEEANRLSLLKKTTSYTQTIVGITHSPILMRRCFILFYTWMVILAVYLGVGMGISGNLDKFINPYLVFLIAAGFEFLSVVTCHLVLDKFGRKYPLVCFMIISSIAIYLIPVHFESRPWISIGFYFMAKYSIGAAQSTCMIFTSELYPTPMRSTGVGLSVALARLGGVWAPQINVLSSTLGSIHVPFYIFSILSLLSGLLCIFLPETLNKQLPDNLSDAKALDNKIRN